MYTLSVPYFRQEREFSCGPATLRMLLAYRDILKTEEELIEALRTSFEGTCNDIMVDVASRFHACTVHNFSVLDDLFRHIHSDTPVMVNYLNPQGDIGHFAVIVGYTDTHLILHDPKNGPEYPITHSDFDARWVSGDGTYVRWGLVLATHH